MLEPNRIGDAVPLEATADVVQVTVHAAKATNSTRAARPFLRTLLRLADYLVDNGLYHQLQKPSFATCLFAISAAGCLNFQYNAMSLQGPVCQFTTKSALYQSASIDP